MSFNSTPTYRLHDRTPAGIRHRPSLGLVIGFLGIGTVALPLSAITLHSRHEGFASHFPDATWERETVYLTKEERDRVAELAGHDMVQFVIHTYTARHSSGEVRGIAYLDHHRVRTLAETVNVLIDPTGNIIDLQVLEFHEPVEYLPRREWYEQFLGKRLTPGLNLKRDIDGVTGATLTTRATTQAARRMLAVHEVISDRE